MRQARTGAGALGAGSSAVTEPSSEAIVPMNSSV
jgi:hypothetical protein